MAVDHYVAIQARPAVRANRPRVLMSLTAHAARALARNPIAAFFTLGFPLSFLVIVASILADQSTGAGVPVAQFLVAPFAVFGVAQASFTLIAVDLAGLRENGVLLRLRAAPVPAWTVLGARIGASVVASGTAVVLMTAVGVLAYDVEIVWRKVPALLVTLLLGIVCCAALGLALASLTRTTLAAQTLAQGLLIPLAFISDVFIVGADLPRALDVTGSVLPLKHFAQAMAETFHPDGGYGFSPAHLAMLAAWAAVGVVVARLRFGWQPRGSSTPRAAAEPPVPAVATLSPPRDHGHHRSAALLAGQIAYAMFCLRRDLLSVFFTVVFPALLLVLLPTVFGDGRIHGLPMAQYLFAGMIAYTAAVAGYVDLPETVVATRSAGVLKRLRGTPLPFRWYIAGRACAALLTAALGAAVLASAGIGFLGVQVDPVRLPAVLLAIAAGSSCFTALGLAVVALLPAARSVVAVTLGTLLPLCFVSEIFVVGDQPMPGWLTRVADAFPLRHLLYAVLTATSPDGSGAGIPWEHLAVLAGWTAFAVLVVRWRRTALV